ncbi:probable xyloglucan endotransglucosylase/hydrolase protein 12 [Asparagus officinalis]|uniref:probable xyloglucan endotransglucosylase/hydrolase protein 12 n=1 Tax=Asparagus officinalis TaxID=4686 RepID=UPI00098DEA17|nr:probable xyloglucan endotransglucosylase/hydrolase protein 12 [Asparagus officinalis]
MGKQFLLLLKAIVIVGVALIRETSSESFSTDVDVTGGTANVQDGGNQLQLTLDQAGGSEVQSKQKYLYGRFDMRIKVVPGYSAGVVTSFFLQSPRPTNDEMDFELLGNVTGEPYLLHTNVWTNGVGNREEQINLWFDPRADFHTYTFIWNPRNIIWFVDGTPVRLFKNAPQQGVPYLSKQFLNAYAALWNGDEWATRRGQIKTDWSKAPFVATYRNFNSDACINAGRGYRCSQNRGQWWDITLDARQLAKLRWVRKNYMVYDYCRDTTKYPQGFPPECSINV